MSQVNAPQPDAPSANNCETFDSTIVPAEGQVSQDQLPGPNNSEGPMHTGEANGIDPFLFVQFIALTSFIWDTSASVGQLLWFIEIHPSKAHQFLAHLAEMYNAFVGGLEFAITIAGTGFHAGKLLIVRLPPNIKPTSLKTVADITAFPFFVIDPKTLECVVKSAMDQRNIMYHYLPLDINDMNSFGGYLAVYVLLPLNTSATGATQISVQVFSKPARDFMFTQLRPIRKGSINPFRPESIERALDFELDRSNPVYNISVKSLVVHPLASLRELTVETQNCYQLDGQLMNGVYFQRFPEVWEIDIAQFDVQKIKSVGIETDNLYPADPGDQKYIGFKTVSGSKYLLSFDNIYMDSGKQSKYPKLSCSSVMWGVGFDAGKKKMGFLLEGQLRARTGDDPEGVQEMVLQWTGDLDGWNFSICKAAKTAADCFPQQYLDNLIKNGKMRSVLVSFRAPVTTDEVFKPYAPPIAESLITFNTDQISAAQPFELRDAILQSDFKGAISKENSFVFELVDTQVGLPIMPVRLHYQGYFSTTSVQKELVFKLTDPKRYSLVYIGTIPSTTPLVSSRLPLKSPQKYAYNLTISRMSSSL